MGRSEATSKNDKRRRELSPTIWGENRFYLEYILSACGKLSSLSKCSFWWGTQPEGGKKRERSLSTYNVLMSKNGVGSKQGVMRSGKEKRKDAIFLRREGIANVKKARRREKEPEKRIGGRMNPATTS